ncbi:MAG: hypothetical protein A2007_06445 [Verrucomicrobia bacterium GWC2_42_7]|nr:MAG: hypothetical protein A2007_06445 [Verrucomicrobia bacterium GWC2_42_7]
MKIFKLRRYENLSVPEQKGFRAFQRKAIVAKIKSVDFSFAKEGCSFFLINYRKHGSLKPNRKTFLRESKF